MSTKAMQTVNNISNGPLSLGKALRAIRLSDELSQGEFARRLSVTQSYLSDLENNRKEVSAQKAASFAKRLGHSEKQFIRLALQDALARQGLFYNIELKDVA